MMKRSWTQAFLVSAGLLLLSIVPAHALFIERDVFTDLDVSFDLITPDGSVNRLDLTGSAQFDVTFPVLEGDATDDDGNGLDEVQTEMVALSLTGSTGLGLVTVTLRPGASSLGLIEEQVNNNAGLLDVDPFAPGVADSFFDIFVELDVDGTILHNIDPARIGAVFDNKPPPASVMGAMLGSFGDVRLFDENGEFSDVIVRGSASSQVPEPAALAIFGLGLLGLGFARRRRVA